jgi:hypothetical protein
MTDQALATGAAWRCTRCGQHWDATRLETVAAYARYLAARAIVAMPTQSLQETLERQS